MIKKIFLCICIIFLSYCEEDNTITTCNSENPLEDLAFLKEAKDTIDKVDCAGKSSIVQYTYNSETVFLINIYSQIANGQTLVYNCGGEIVCKFGGIAGENTCTDFEKNATNKIILLEN